ncbi:MAG: hypothetical protein DWQ01_14825 [Planctomycetota bacterium]|nr:MAG: hypothetical protein DWQ01_14825 [Planctomycetota bacterium]
MSFLRKLLSGQNPATTVADYPTLDAEEQELLAMVRDTVSRFRDQSIQGDVHDRQKEIPDPVRQGLAELGLFGLLFPEQVGGMGLGMRAYMEVLRSLAWDCQSTATLLGGHLSLAGRGLLLFGNEEQKGRWLPVMASGECVGAFALTEPGAGSDFRSLRTKAVRVEGGWQLNGNKLWITNGSEAGMFLTFARLETAEDGLAAFLVDASSSGVQVGRPEDKLGLNGSNTNPVDFDQVFVPDRDLLGQPGEGFKIAAEILNRGRAGWAGTCLGASERALHEARDHAAQRVQYGHAIEKFGMIREFLAEMASDVALLQAFMDLTGGLGDAGETELVLESAALKIFATEVQFQSADLALQIAGGNGFSREYPYERLLRDARVSRIFEGTNEVLRMLVAMLAAAAGKQGWQGQGSWAAPETLAEAWHPHWHKLYPESERLHQEAVALAAKHGKQFRMAECDHRRLADRAISLGVRTATLLRLAAEPDFAAAEAVRYGLLRQERRYLQVETEAQAPLDEAMEQAVRGLLQEQTAALR